jgi:glycosyltransferase involved in cell wall biosynthesis
MLILASEYYRSSMEITIARVILVNPYGEIEMANAMTRLLTNVDLCREMGSRARARFERGFTIEHVAHSIESVLEATA